MVVREEHPETGTRLLRRDSLPPVFVGAPAIEHRVVAAVADRDAVDRRPVCWEVFRLAFEHPENGVSKVLVGLVVRRSGDLLVLLGDEFGFLEDCREIVVSHDSTEVRMRLRPSTGAKNPVAGSPLS
jgi:hypothetical protein